MSNLTEPNRSGTSRTYQTSLADLDGRATIDVWSATRPNFAGLVGYGRSRAYKAANAGEFPGVVRLGPGRMVVAVPAVLAWLGQEVS
jgi:predicted DNA-binding transcriptional regulator AlpA